MTINWCLRSESNQQTSGFSDQRSDHTYELRRHIVFESSPLLILSYCCVPTDSALLFNIFEVSPISSYGN